MAAPDPAPRPSFDDPFPTVNLAASTMTYSQPPHYPTPQWPPPPYGFPPPPPPRKSKRLVWILLGVGGLVIVLICGGVIGLAYFGFNIIEKEIRNQVRDNPVLIQHIGSVESLEVDLTESAALKDDDTFVYHVKGSKGTGVLTVKHITNDAGDEEIEWAELRLPDNRVIKIQ
jgi:hypothetical protein